MLLLPELTRCMWKKSLKLFIAVALDRCRFFAVVVVVVDFLFLFRTIMCFYDARMTMARMSVVNNSYLIVKQTLQLIHAHTHTGSAIILYVLADFPWPEDRSPPAVGCQAVRFMLSEHSQLEYMEARHIVYVWHIYKHRRASQQIQTSVCNGLSNPYE